MRAKHYLRLLGGWAVGGAAVATTAYAAYAGITWYRYGHATRRISGAPTDSLLDIFMPEYEIAECHHIAVLAPAETTFAAACEVEMAKSGITQAIFRARELALGCVPGSAQRKSVQLLERNVGRSEPKGLIEDVKAQGWEVLAEIPGREIILGTVTQPWVKNTVFRSVPPEEFASFEEPGYVKIVFTLRADPVTASQSVARTETRVVTTDAEARTKFRRYWALFSPGIILIRRALLRSVKNEAELRANILKPQYETADFGEFAEQR
jgi:hypothetical protein